MQDYFKVRSIHCEGRCDLAVDTHKYSAATT